MSPRSPNTRRPAPASPSRPNRRHGTTPRHLRVRAVMTSARALLRIGGEVDIDTAPHLRRALDTALDTGVGRVDVDMRRVTFCDSTAVHALLHARAKAAELGVGLTLAPGDRLHRVLDITDTLHLFTRLASPPPLPGIAGVSRAGPDHDEGVEGATP